MARPLCPQTHKKAYGRGVKLTQWMPKGKVRRGKGAAFPTLCHRKSGSEDPLFTYAIQKIYCALKAARILSAVAFISASSNFT